MAFPSSVPPIQWTDAGIILPTADAVLAGVHADVDAAFGGGTNPALETPQGQLSSSQAAVINDKNAEIATIVNQVDPQYASGRFQDAIGRIYMMDRKGALPTVVSCLATGVPGKTLPAGVLAQDTSGNTYVSSGEVTFAATGTAQVEFQNVVNGPIPCPAGTLTVVYQAVDGWDAIANPTDGTLGRLVETRADFEYRRKNSVAINAHGSPEAIYGEVFAVDGVIDCYVIDNYTGAAVNTGATNYPVAANSVYVAAVGGVDADVAQAIWRKKDLGCNMNGNTSVTLTDPSGYSYPQPTYVYKFERPDALAVKFAVRIVNDPSLPSNIVSLIQDAIVARFNGVDGTTRERIGALILASRYYGAVVSVYQNVQLLDVLIGTSTPTLTQVAVGIDQRPTVSSSDISVTLV